MTNIVLADDHAVLREGVKAILNSVSGLQVVGEASDGFEAVSLVERVRPDLIVIDISMPNLGGIEAVARLRKLHEKLAIIILSARDDETSVADAMRAGANGYVTKASGAEELEFAIKSVLKGQRYLSPAVCGPFLVSSLDGGLSRHASPMASLTAREREVIKLLAEGHPNREVAKLLHVSPRTIDSHRANILRKLGITTNAELVQLALKHGIVE